MDLACRRLPLKAGPTSLMESLQFSGFDYVMLALKHTGRGSAEMPMIMAVGVGRPLCDELDYAGGHVNARDCHGIVDRVIELWAARQMLPIEMVRLETRY